jgi:hypothetical protein
MKTGLSDMDAELGWRHPTYVSALMQYETFQIEEQATRSCAQGGFDTNPTMIRMIRIRGRSSGRIRN